MNVFVVMSTDCTLLNINPFIIESKCFIELLRLNEAFKLIERHREMERKRGKGKELRTE